MAPKKMYSRLKKKEYLQDSTKFMMVLHTEYCHVLFSINTQNLWSFIDNLRPFYCEFLCVKYPTSQMAIIGADVFLRMNG